MEMRSFWRMSKLSLVSWGEEREVRAAEQVCSANVRDTMTGYSKSNISFFYIILT